MQSSKKNLKLNLFYFKKKIEKFWPFILIGFFIVVLNFIITLSSSIPIIVNIYNSTIGEKQYWLDKINKLAPATNISYFKSEFGEPTFINYYDDKKSKEYIFVNKFFYLDAVTDLNDKVKYYAVTTRDPQFNPIFKSSNFNYGDFTLLVKLGITKFSDLPNNPIFLEGCAGARRAYYYEKYYLGNPGNYQNFGFALNDAGYWGEETIGNIDSISIYCSWNKDYKFKEKDESNKLLDTYWINGEVVKEEPLKSFRQDTIINTYVVTAPFEDFPTIDSMGIGADLDQVRILNDK